MLKIITLKIDEKDYPEILRNITNPPKKIYVEGNVKNLNKPGIAIVGSRKCSDYGMKMCKTFTQNLVDYNINIISGMAIGIDAVAHSAAIKNLGTTIAVLPSGFDKVYPRENIDLYKKIIDSGGTVVTEYLPEVEADKEKFRKRNRIVSGLAIGVLVVEGNHMSGSQITARLAKKEGKPVFCIPNSLDSKNGFVPNDLIKKGAFLITDINDILSRFGKMKFSKRELSKVDKNKINMLKSDNLSTKSKITLGVNINEELVEIYNAISNEATEIDEICELTSKSINEVNYKLTMLEIEGLVKELPGRRFIKNV